MDARLEQVILANNRMEKRLHVDAAVLVTIEFKERGSAEEVAALHRQLRGDCEEAVVVYAFLAVVGWRIVLPEQLVQSFHVCLSE